jgi:integrase
MTTPAARRGRKPALVPSYRLHKACGQAIVTIRGRDFYLGPYGSDSSRQRYADVLTADAHRRPLDPFARSRSPSVGEVDAGPSVAVLCLAFLDYAEGYYVKNGRQTDEVDCYRSLIRLTRPLLGHRPAAELTAADLRLLRNQMIEADWARGFINRQVNRFRHLVKWGVGRDLVPPNVLGILQAVEPLRQGRSNARETRPRTAVPNESILAVKAVLRSNIAAALIDLQLQTAARPGELIGLTAGEVDRSGPIWLARLRSHKTQHFGKSRVLVFGLEAQQILRPFLDAALPDGRLFAIRRETYSRTIREACIRAGVPPFVPHELRHTAGTQILNRFGFEAARAMMGQSHPSMTLHYTSEMTKKAVETAAALGDAIGAERRTPSGSSCQGINGSVTKSGR